MQYTPLLPEKEQRDVTSPADEATLMLWQAVPRGGHSKGDEPLQEKPSLWAIWMRSSLQRPMYKAETISFKASISQSYFNSMNFALVYLICSFHFYTTRALYTQIQ